jgi:hypothetical protein
MVVTMARDERDALAANLADKDGLARLTERGFDPHLTSVGQKLVETRTPDDPDVRDRCHGR